MIQKTIGYVLAFLGIVGIVISSEGVSKALSLPIPSTIGSNTILIISIIVVVIGLALAVKGTSSKQPAEVPIYEGKNVVGYRRMGKK